MEKQRAYLIVNFGGPRDMKELKEFLISLLTDQDVVRTNFPPLIHRLLFQRVAKRRAKVIAPDYELIGGKSPIFEDTETIAAAVAAILKQPVLTFHRYLPGTHTAFIQACEQLQCDELCVFPLFPQFSYATTGSIARWFSKHLCGKLLVKMRWTKSYPEHPAFVGAFQRRIREFLQENQIPEEDTVLLFSPHGLPQKFICTGDLYANECQASFKRIACAFGKAKSLISYQSQFGKEEWIRPYTSEYCQEANSWGKGYRHIVLIPLSFTSDHIETLYEMEHLYLPVLREKGFHAWRCPALNCRQDWIEGIAQMMQENDTWGNQSLIRQEG